METSAHVEPVWGDGFCDDTFSDLVRVSNWDTLSPDEYVFLYPLLGTAAHRQLPPVVLDHVRSALASLHALDPIRDQSGRAAPSHGTGRLLVWLQRRDPADHRVIGPEEERPLTSILNRILDAQRSGSTVPYDRTSAVRVAFGAGLNPGYVWSEAVAEPETMLLAGWLGHLDRGRRALIPGVLANALSELNMDAVDRLGGGIFQRTRQALQSGALDAIRSAAARKLVGRNVVVCFPRRRVPRLRHLVGNIRLMDLRRTEGGAALT